MSKYQQYSEEARKYNMIIFEDEDVNDDWITTIGQMRKVTEDV